MTGQKSINNELKPVIYPEMMRMIPDGNYSLLPQKNDNRFSTEARIIKTPKEVYTIYPNFLVHPSFGTQSETPITRHPTNPLIMLASANTYRGATTFSTGVYVNPYAVADPVIRAWIVGKTDLEYCMFRGIDVEVAHQRRDRFKQVTESRKAIEWEERMTDNEGVTRIFLRRLFPVFSEDGQRIACLIGNGIEITERRKAREELEANKRFTEAVLNNSPHLIFVKDKSERTVRCP